MEKVIYPIWKQHQQSITDFREKLLGPLSEQLHHSGAKKIQIAIVDEAVDAAEHLRQENNKPLMDAVISLWLDSHIYQAQQQHIIEQYTERCHAYLATESEPIINTQHPAKPGERTQGMCQVVFIQRPDRLSHDKWLDIWHNHHTSIAIETQTTFGYRQNTIVRALSNNAPPLDAVVEENFPEAAMHSHHAFYNAYDEKGREDDTLLATNSKRLIDSVLRFIDLEKIDVIATSEYCVTDHL